MTENLKTKSDQGLLLKLSDKETQNYKSNAPLLLCYVTTAVEEQSLIKKMSYLSCAFFFFTLDYFSLLGK